MNSKHVQAVAEDLYEAWDLNSKDEADILSAIEEAYLRGAFDGRMDSSVFEEAQLYFEEIVDVMPGEDA